MRSIIFVTLSVFMMACLSPKKAVPSKETKAANLNGTWVPINEELGGATLPVAAFQNQRLTINDTLYTVVAESVDRGVVKSRNEKMDIYGKEGPNAGKHFTAIYKLDGDQLTICYNLAGDAFPDGYETKGKPAYFLAVFKKTNGTK